MPIAQNGPGRSDKSTVLRGLEVTTVEGIPRIDDSKCKGMGTSKVYLFRKLEI